MTSSRAARLQVLQKLTEMQEFLSFMRRDSECMSCGYLCLRKLPSALNYGGTVSEVERVEVIRLGLWMH